MCSRRSNRNQVDRRSLIYEYLRNGTTNIFMMYAQPEVVCNERFRRRLAPNVRNRVQNKHVLRAPLEGRREALVTERRTKVDYAHAIRHLVDVMYADAEKIVLVQDNLNTHKPASLYAAFPPDEARRPIDKLEIHYTPNEALLISGTGHSLISGIE
jgi:hypothetical protein